MIAYSCWMRYSAASSAALAPSATAVDLPQLLERISPAASDAGHARLAHAVGDDVARGIALHGIVQELDVGHRADGDEQRRAIDGAFLAAYLVPS